MTRFVSLLLVMVPMLAPPLLAQDEAQPEKTTVLAFKKVPVEELIPFIVEATGKVVMPQDDILTRRITVLNDQPIPVSEALDLVLLALQQNGIAVVEDGDIITLRDITEIVRQDVPVIGPEVSLLDRKDKGTIVEKIFALTSGSAENLGEVLEDALPDYAQMTVDPDSNQIAIIGSIALLQRMERLITSLDRPGADALKTETFRLRYADAEQIAEAIEDLFSADATARNARTNQQANRNPRFQFQPQAQQQQATRTSEQLRVKANTQQNAVTVVAEPDILEQIRDQIENHWDLPLPEEAVIPKIYDLENSDPIKVRDLLAELFGEPEQAGAQQSSQGVGRLAGQFSFEAIPESGRLVVVAKSPDHLAVIDQIVRDLDKPQTVGLPAIVELKHASAEELAEQLNTLLAEEGTIAQLPRQESGLSEDTASQSPFSQNTQQQQQQQPAEQDVIGFWWQQARPPTDSRGSSNLVGQIRLVPVWRQNAIMVLAPPEYRQSVVDLIEQLDQPGRQVLISAIILEISRDDATNLGLRWSSNPLNLSSAENAFSIGANANATENNFLGSLFDTSVLSANADLNAVLQALAQRTSVNILSEPKLFTSDNQEAQFFDGQDIAFPVSSTTTASGQIQQQFDYRAVGLQLRVRPRITPNQQVDLLINLELSAIRPGDLVNDLIVVDRRETTTQLIVRGGQTVVISGIFRKEDTDIRRKVPLLGDIPLLGALFTSIEKAKTDSELLLFITPIVVENTQQSDELNEPYRNRLEQLRGKMGDVGVEG